MMKEDDLQINFDHDGIFKLFVDNGEIKVDVSKLRKIVFRDHKNNIRYTFSKIQTDPLYDNFIGGSGKP